MHYYFCNFAQISHNTWHKKGANQPGSLIPWWLMQCISTWPPREYFFAFATACHNNLPAHQPSPFLALQAFKSVHLFQRLYTIHTFFPPSSKLCQSFCWSLSPRVLITPIEFWLWLFHPDVLTYCAHFPLMHSLPFLPSVPVLHSALSIKGFLTSSLSPFQMLEECLHSVPQSETPVSCGYACLLWQSMTILKITS